MNDKKDCLQGGEDKMHWTVGVPPVGERVAIVCRKWSGTHEQRYVEVIAHDPSLYLQTMGLNIMMTPSVTVIYGSVFTQGGVTGILNEHGMPVAAYPNSILAWSKVPDDFLQNLQAAVMTDLAVGRANNRAKSAP
ncbi:MAG: hypothetical protein EOP24_39195 [Hyphomicrobiales bacterium]|nr:MAG: hypothetical protein EOP24_39195 [Hyphomicrobiales bacterium]